MLPLVLLAALATAFALSQKKSQPSEISVAPGDLYRIRVAVPGADHQQIEAMYRFAMAQVGQIGSLIWDGDVMIVQVQYLKPSTITLGEMRAGTTTINVLAAELLYRGTPPVTMAPPISPQAAATVGAIVKRAVRSGDPAEIIGAAALAEQAGAPELARKLVRAAQNTGYRVRA